MTAWVALLLAAALIVLPHGPNQIQGRGLSRRVRRITLAATSAVAASTAAYFLPLSALSAIGMIAATAAIRMRRRRTERLVNVELANLESGLDILVGELRAGMHPVQAFGIAAHELDGQVGLRFMSMAARARLGVDLISEQVQLDPLAPQWDRIKKGWDLAQQHGVAVADLLGACRGDIAEFQRFASRVNAGLAGARATALVLTGLPLVGVVLGQLIGAHPIRVLLSGGLGGGLLVIGVALACAGLLWADQISLKALR